MKKKNVKKQFFLVLIFVIIILIISSLLFPKQKKINNVSYSINFTKSNLGTKLEAYIKDSSYEADILKADGNKTIYGVINDTLENGNLFLTKGLFLYDIESEELKYYEFNEYSRVIDFIIFDNKIYQVILENDTEDSSIKWKIQVQELNNSISWIVKEGTLIDVFKYPRLFIEDDNLYITTLTNFEKNSEGYAKEKYSLSKIENNVLKELISYEGSLIKEEGILAYNIMNVKIENSIFYHTIVDENSIQRLMAYNIKNKENKEIKSNDSKNLILYSYIPIKNSMYIQYAYKNQTNRAKFEFDSKINESELNTFENKINKDCILFHNTGNRWYIYDTSNNKYIKLSNNRNNFYPKYIVLGENTILTEDFENNYYIGKIERN